MAPPYPEPATSGTYFSTGADDVNGAAGGQDPGHAPTIDFDTDINRCGVASVLPA